MRTLALLLLCTLGLAARDHATLKTGALLTGDLVSVHREGFFIELDEGPRFVRWEDLGAPGLQTSGQIVVLLPNGDRITARIMRVEHRHLVMTSAFIPEALIPTNALPASPLPAPPAAVPDLGGHAPQDADAKGALDEKDWNGSIALLGTLRSGNTDSSLFQFNAGLNRQWVSDRFNATASASWGRTEEEQTAKNALATTKWDHFYNDDLYSHGRVEVEHDEIKNLDLRLTTGVGIGLNVWRGDDAHEGLDLEAGTDYLHQRFDGADAEAGLAGRIAVVFKARLFDTWLLTEDCEIVVPVGDPAAFITHSQTKLETSLSGRWNLQNILDIEYRGDAPTDTSALDIKLLVGLEYKF